MSSKYKAYPEYKKSGSDLIVEIPESWKMLRGKYVFSEFNERSVTGTEKLLSVSEYYGVKPREEVVGDGDFLSRAESLEGYKKCEKNDLVMNIMLAWKRGLGVTRFDGIVSPAYSVFRFNENAKPNYMHYLLRTDTYTNYFKTRSTGVIDSRLRLYPENFGNVPFILPPIAQQEHIVSFLDYETAKIDTLIEEQQTLIRLLKEKRQAVISHAVTKGLNPDAPMKDSGVEWLGEVPEKWESMQLRRVIKTMEQGKSPECENREAEVGEWGVLKTSCVNRGVFDFKANKALPPKISPFTQYEVKPGDIMMSRASGSIDLIGSVAHVVETQPRILLSDKIFRLHLNPLIESAYFAFLMQSSFMRKQVEQAISGAEGMANNITKGAVMGFVFALPPLNEQAKIINYLNGQLTLIDKLIEEANTFVKMLIERRAALISDAVTGKIDVRSWKPSDTSQLTTLNTKHKHSEVTP
ncbi:hypothetical protein [Endozoicomonas sp.]|uniref:hypothetical protein n=1 Tax=Endozoicomonas sp. TaxID=1892382 RepID=UPI003AF8F28B